MLRPGRPQHDAVRPALPSRPAAAGSGVVTMVPPIANAAAGTRRRAAPAAGSLLRRLLAHRPSTARLVAHQVIVFVALLLVAIQLVTFIAIDSAVADNARKKIREEIDVGHRVFLRLLAERTRQLTTAARVLTSDFGLRQALMSGDQATMVSALGNHGSRIGAAKMMLVGLDQRVLADTSSARPASTLFAFPPLIAEAERAGSASTIAMIDHVPYQLVVVPVLAPVPVAWAVVGFSVDAKLAADLGALAALDVSFATREYGDGWRIAASTMRPEASQAVLRALRGIGTVDIARIDAALGGADYEVSASLLARDGNGAVVAVLQRSLRDAIAQFDALRKVLLALGAFSLFATVAGSLLIARSISRPIAQLAAFARRIEHGDYEQGPPQARSSELGELAAAFNRMRLAIAAREGQIKAMACQDALTGLPNRALFNERLQQAVAVARRAGHRVSVLLIDLDRFKEVNDTLGHQVGDVLLCEVAARLRGALGRATDTPARLGGDEFAVLLPAADLAMALATARKILTAFEAPLVFEGRRLDVTGSIGAATFPDHGEDPNVIVSRADAAMYAAKRGHLGCAGYNRAVEGEGERLGRLSLSGELRQAVEQDQLVLYYQPRLDLADDRVTEVEALLRWNHPDRGFLSPDHFILFAEQTGCIGEITRWVLDRAFAQCASWRAQGLAVGISINLSARDLLAADLPERIAELLRRRAARAQWFRLEITESAIIDDPARALETVARLHDMGFGLSIDDFGAGYSSLAQLKRLPVTELKIDKSFVIGMGRDTDDMTIVRSVIDLGHNMGLRVVAEGVENAEVLALLRHLRCDLVQGYHVCRPLPGDRLETWLRGGEWRRADSAAHSGQLKEA